MCPNTDSGESRSSDGSSLLYPFYLDEDMSTAFAASITGGVAVESEEVSRQSAESRSVRSLRGALRLYGAGIDGKGERSSATDEAVESTSRRRHTAQSIFLDLHDELTARGQIAKNPEFGSIQVGQLVELSSPPAVAPLRRVVDGVIRLLELVDPVIEDKSGKRAGQANRKKSTPTSPPEDTSLMDLRNLFSALRDDLDHSGMIDMAISGDPELGEPGIVLTLDKRFASEAAIEIAHSSSFTIVGKVTSVWPTEDDLVQLYRRSVVSLLPALSQQVALGVFAFLASLAKEIGIADESEVNSILGLPVEESSDDSDESTDQVPSEGLDEIRFGDDIAAVNPILSGPAIQVLPLALCV